jgi:DNA replication protein DnaC
MKLRTIGKEKRRPMEKRTIPETAIPQTTTNNLQPVRKLIKSKEYKSGDVEYIENTYNIEHYGEAEYLMIKGRTDGDFRKVRAMIPYEFIGKKPKDFDWNLYGCDTDIQKRIANGFIINFDKCEKKGKGLYIYSKTRGSGKTLLASCLVNQLIDTRPINAKFINVLDLIELTKKGFKHESSSEELEGIFNTRLLVLDDLGVQMNKEWSETVLYRLINHRKTNKLVTIFTSNIPVNELKTDDRIPDRIFEITVPLNIPEVAIRNMKAKDENAEFIKEII